jgi:two-component system phosphate regulon response regulator PhoB/two-component system alkaline phosphatase synthesis response regulator PhoP
MDTIKLSGIDMAEKQIIVLDDEPDILELVTLHLSKSGFSVKGYTSVVDFYEGLKKANPALIILDLMLPDSDGFEILKELKKDERYINIPVIMLTARGDEIDKVLGLELGADDYITKPFSPKEFTARIKAILRRAAPKKVESKRVIGNITIDLQRYEVEVDGTKIELTSTEFKILSILSEKLGWVFSREQILNYLWGNEKMVIDRTIDVHIRHLREKLGSAGDLIKNIRGVGYKIES